MRHLRGIAGADDRKDLARAARADHETDELHRVRYFVERRKIEEDDGEGVQAFGPVRRRELTEPVLRSK